MPHYVYIIYSPSRDWFYIGETCNVQQRLEQHNSGFYSGAEWHHRKRGKMIVFPFFICILKSGTKRKRLNPFGDNLFIVSVFIIMFKTDSQPLAIKLQKFLLPELRFLLLLLLPELEPEQMQLLPLRPILHFS